VPVPIFLDPAKKEPLYNDPTLQQASPEHWTRSERIMIDKATVFDLLKRRKKAELLELLSAAFDAMEPKQRRAVFTDLVRESRPVKLDGASLLKEVETFHRESLAGKYYAPFMINSKNFTHIPDETDEWCDRIADLLKQASQLTGQGDHLRAVKCFALLFEVIGKMEYGDEIVFADEMGSWMIPIEEKEWIAAYLMSLAATCDPDEFATKALPLIRRDSGQSFHAEAYKSALMAANKDQKARLKAETQRQKIRTGPSPRLLR
jgi:hypothetical protein